MSTEQPPPKDSGAGYPEDAPEGMGVEPTEHAENQAAGKPSPQANPEKDGDPGQATGNPKAAGADS